MLAYQNVTSTSNDMKWKYPNTYLYFENYYNTIQAFTIEFKSHWVPYSFGLVPHLSKKLSKLLKSMQYQK